MRSRAPWQLLQVAALLLCLRPAGTSTSPSVSVAESGNFSLFSSLPLSSIDAEKLLFTDVASILPLLPSIAAPKRPADSFGSSTLVITLATQGFKRLLLNFLCFFNHRVRSHRLLVFTSSPELARWLTGHNVTVLLLGKLRDQDQTEVPNTSDPFANLRRMGLLIDSEESPEHREKMIEWGSLHYQSLMLERSVVVASIVAQLSRQQNAAAAREPNWAGPRVRRIVGDNGTDYWQRDRRVDGVLVVDNDAVWLQSPTPSLTHSYKRTGRRPSVIYALDQPPDEYTPWGGSDMPCACFFYARTSDVRQPPMSIGDCDSCQQTSSSDIESTKAPFTTTSSSRSPSAGAAQIWMHTALCHISSVLFSLHGAAVSGRIPITASASDPKRIAPLTASILSSLPGAIAPSFQGNSLGPVVHLAEAGALPHLSMDEFVTALGSGKWQDLDRLLDRYGLAPPPLATAELWDDGDWNAAADRCLVWARAAKTTSRNPDWPVERASLGLLGNVGGNERLPPPPRMHKWKHGSPHAHEGQRPTNADHPHRHASGQRENRNIEVDSLPYSLFPSGQTFFDVEQREAGVEPVVVHANYALGKSKERRLKKAGLWALIGPEEGEGSDEIEWMCDRKVLEGHHGHPPDSMFEPDAEVEEEDDEDEQIAKLTEWIKEVQEWEPDEEDIPDIDF